MSEPEVIHQQLIEKIKTDPLVLYNDFKERIDKDGIHAEFPEFAPVIHFLKKTIHDKEMNDLCSKNEYIQSYRDQVDLELLSVSISNSWYPYDSTLHAICSAIKFLDFKERVTNVSSNTEFYHSYRYLYYFDRLINQAPNLIIFPTYLGLGATDMLKMFGSPIYIVGVNTKSEYVDEFLQTPYEFFIHDINHIRRFSENNDARYEDEKVKGVDKIAYYTTQRDLINKLIDMIVIKKNMTDEEKNIRQAMKIILFEILHEEAEPPIKEIICQSILRRSSEVYIGPKGAKFNEIGSSSNNVIDIVPVTTPGASLLSFVRFKLWYGFYDDVKNFNKSIASLDARKIHTIALAAQRLLDEICEMPDYNINELTNLIADNTGLNEPKYISVFHESKHEYQNEVDKINKTTAFSGIRPTTKPAQFFSQIYKDTIPWTGIKKPDLAKFVPTNPLYDKLPKEKMGGGILSNIHYFTRMLKTRSCFLLDCDKRITRRKKPNFLKKTKKNRK